LITVLISLIFLSSAYFSCSDEKSDSTSLQDGNNDKSGQNKSVNNENAGENKSTGTAALKDEVVIKTDDGKDISANYFYNSADKEKAQPVVILIHQFKQSKEQWKQDFVDSLLANGYKVLAFDIRGHGKSSKQDGDISDLLSSPDEAPVDIKAVVSWCKNEKGIDSSRVAAIGTSIGGNLVLYAGLNLGVKVPVAISNGQKTFEAYTGYNELMMGRPYFPKIKNAFLVCGTKDGDCEKGQKWILENFLEAPKEMKVYDSDKHGKSLIEEHPEINSLIINWLKKYL
jgi:dienelactone hydrolase